jgi:hypothetical protein
MRKREATITIGRNIGNKPMSKRDWDSFKREVSEVFEVLYVNGAESRGVWQGVTETSAVFVGLLCVANEDVVSAKLAVLAKKYKQDAIGFIVNLRETSLVGKAA